IGQKVKLELLEQEPAHIVGPSVAGSSENAAEAVEQLLIRADLLHERAEYGTSIARDLKALRARAVVALQNPVGQFVGADFRIKQDQRRREHYRQRRGDNRWPVVYGAR